MCHALAYKFEYKTQQHGNRLSMAKILKGNYMAQVYEDRLWSKKSPKSLSKCTRKIIIQECNPSLPSYPTHFLSFPKNVTLYPPQR